MNRFGIGGAIACKLSHNSLCNPLRAFFLLSTTIKMCTKAAVNCAVICRQCTRAAVAWP